MKTGNGDDTIVVVGMGPLPAYSEAPSGSPPTDEMNSFTLTTGSGANTVVISLDWLGSEADGYTPARLTVLTPRCRVTSARMPRSRIRSRPLNEELDAAAQAMVGSGNPQSLNASHVYLTIGNAAGSGANLVTLSDITISPSTPEIEATNR